MIRIYQKWWLLRQFHIQVGIHTPTTIESYNPVYSYKEFFIKGNEKYPGIVFLFPWPWKQKRDGLFNLENMNQKRYANYHDIFDACLREKYLEISSATGVPVKGEKFDQMWGFPQLINNEYNGLNGFLKTLGWTITIIIALGQQHNVLNFIKNEYSNFIQSQYNQQVKPHNEVIQLPETPR